MKYRPEVDGLRALAVVPVILFHAGFAPFQGGFVGVDVFFVISGYLITGIIARELEAGRFSILSFYDRRARRILPALFCMMLVTWPVAWFTLSPSRFDSFSESFVAAAVFLSNVHFWQSVDYFAPITEAEPLLHTWSLAVEEQYYIVFPVLMILLWRFGLRFVLWVLVSLFVASLALSQWGATHRPEVNFFFTPSRFWELLAGAILALLPQASGHSARNVALSTGGIGLLCLAVFGYDASVPFPSVYALLPVVGTMLILRYAEPDWGVGWLLASRPVVGIGLLSYSAYLWHQPLFAFARYIHVLPLPKLVMGGLILLTFLLAYLSWRFIERPFRTRSLPVIATPKRALSLSAVAIAACVLIGQTADNTRAFEARISQTAAQMYRFLDYRGTSDYQAQFPNKRCWAGGDSDQFQAARIAECVAHDDAAPTVLVLGDSHAAHLITALRDHFDGVQFLLVSDNGCRPVMGGQGAERCRQAMRYAFQTLIPTGGIDAVVLSGQWADKDLEPLRKTLGQLGDQVGQVVLFGPTVEYQADLPEILANLPEPILASHRLAEHPYSRPDRREMDRKLRALSTDKAITYVSLLDHLCPRHSCKVRTETGEPMAFDYGHFTLTGAKELVRDLHKTGQLAF